MPLQATRITTTKWVRIRARSLPRPQGPFRSKARLHLIKFPSNLLVQSLSRERGNRRRPRPTATEPATLIQVPYRRPRVRVSQVTPHDPHHRLGSPIQAPATQIAGFNTILPPRRSLRMSLRRRSWLQLPSQAPTIKPPRIPILPLRPRQHRNHRHDENPLRNHPQPLQPSWLPSQNNPSRNRAQGAVPVKPVCQPQQARSRGAPRKWMLMINLLDLTM